MEEDKSAFERLLETKYIRTETIPVAHEASFSTTFLFEPFCGRIFERVVGRFLDFELKIKCR